MAEWHRKGHIDADQKCTWFPGTTEPNPHTRSEHKPKPKIMKNILENVGNTPLVRLNKVNVQHGLKCELLAKCEFYNAGGSVKDRIGLKMVEDAEKSGRLKPGDILIEPTSGNTGIGLALAAAVKGYKCIIVLPEKMSAEKVDVLKALGAEIVRTPTEAASDSPESHLSVAFRLNKELPNSHILDQYINPGNPMAHYDTTAMEIWDQCDGKLDMVVMSVGTGGTIAGVARRLKELNPNIIVVGVDPLGSILAQPEELNVAAPPNVVEGIGYDFIPRVCDRTVVDKWMKSNDRDSLLMSRRLIRDEGLLVGGSAGATMSCAVEAAKVLSEGQRCVVVCSDSIRNYMTKFLQDSYMQDLGFIDNDVIKKPQRTEWWAKLNVASLPLSTPVCVSPSTTCKEAIQLMHERSFDMVPVTSDTNGNVLGVLTEGNLAAKMTSGKINANDTVEKAMYKQFRKVSPESPVGDLAEIFNKDYYALITTEQEKFVDGAMATMSIVTGIITRIDLLAFISAEEGK